MTYWINQGPPPHPHGMWEVHLCAGRETPTTAAVSHCLRGGWEVVEMREMKGEQREMREMMGEQHNNKVMGDDSRWGGTTRGGEANEQKAKEMSNNISWAVGKFVIILFSYFFY